jgi:ATP-dependent helicase YprA (DUF1998 family)
VNGNIDAVSVSAEIKATYRRYLQSILSVRDPQIDAALRAAIDNSPMLDKGPYLEATPPYAPGSSIEALIREGVLSPGFTAVTGKGLPADRPLYAHQEQAIRKIADGRNVVVATGTGSGKTESFLIPVIDSLIREHGRGELGPGVRALLLYPMNALANDQMKRLRQVLAQYPAITFGRYTGDTEEDPRKARDLFSELNAGETMLPNELLSRREMRETPPHFLLTNYAMLEYLLLRPLDMDLFGQDGDSSWRFIVVDEAHVYDGSQGAEVAMLLRRVRDRVVPGRAIRCIATSATVGSEPEAVMRFAAGLFGESFEWSPTDDTRQDLVLATRMTVPTVATWGPVSPADHVAAWAARNLVDGDALSREASLVRLRNVLVEGPQTIDEVARKVFGEDPDAGAGLAALVARASAARTSDGSAVLSARYHLFLRATEGAFTCLSTSGPHVHLARHEKCPDCSAPVFEFGSCRRCGAVHVIGTPVPEEGVVRLRPRKNTGRRLWLLLGEQLEITDEDEEAVSDDAFASGADEAWLCTGCGAIGDRAASCKGCAATTLRRVRKLKERKEEISGCLVCGARGAGTVRVFETGADASGAVIATSLYQHLPPGQSSADASRPGGGRKLLAFSDSRQAAAYFAPYLEDTYGRLQRRRLITQGLIKARADEEAAAVEDLVFTTRSVATKVGHFTGGKTAQQQAREIAPWVMAEVVATDDRQSLEGLGIVAITLHRELNWAAPRPLLDLGLTEDEAWGLLQELIRSLRQQGAVSMPEEVPPNHEIFAPRLGPIRVRGDGSEAIRKVLSWRPTRGSNRRLDYLRRLLQALGSTEDAERMLGDIWRALIAERSPIDWLRRATEPGLGLLHQVDHEKLRFALVTDKHPVFRCSTCRRTAPFSIRGICPALACDGELEAFFPPAAELEQDHYRSIFRSMNAVPLTALEHTAQWTNVEAAAIQQRFVRGDVNTLSCSTTFELGVDVGELQAVMLRNMPPSTANYVQRAGRAGRRAGTAALVVTYAMRRSHDLTRFAEPEVMIAGHVRAPYVPLENARIGRRHAQSVAMAAFFRYVFENTGRIDRTAGEFFLTEAGQEPTVALAKGFFAPAPDGVDTSLRRILPAEVGAELDLEGGTWATDLVALLDSVRTELETDVSLLEELSVQAAAGKKYQLAQRYHQVGNTLRKRELLGFLANRNVLPKYGFPVDSVELRTNFGFGKHVGARLDLTRDLSQAIYEYAPDATIVAGGQLWTSRGIYRLPGRDLTEFQYQLCRRCGGFWHGLDKLDEKCPFCGEVPTTGARKLTIPEFGFIAGKDPQTPGPRPPKRSWSGAVHLLAPSPKAETDAVTLPGGCVTASFGPRGRLIAIADGPGAAGYWICDWCGAGSARLLTPKAPPKHEHPMKHTPCTGPQRSLDLAHTYETDLLTLDMDQPGSQAPKASWLSVLYALIEAACEVLEIARQDIGGSLTPVGTDRWSIALFDTVPGGAGHVLRVRERLQQVLTAALQRVSNCECGPETSCYGCLRSYDNQREHEHLSRGAAEIILADLLGSAEASAEFAEQASLTAELSPPWTAALAVATGEERAILVSLADAGVECPVMGAESDSGIPIAISWPDLRLAVEINLSDSDLIELRAEGWTVLALGAELCQQAKYPDPCRPSHG